MSAELSGLTHKPCTVRRFNDMSALENSREAHKESILVSGQMHHLHVREIDPVRLQGIRDLKSLRI